MNIQNSPQTALPLILAGPILRHVGTDAFTLWWVSSEKCSPELTLQQANTVIAFAEEHAQHQQTQVGTHAFIHLLHIQQQNLFDSTLSANYQLSLKTKTKTSSLHECCPTMFYGKETTIPFGIPDILQNVYHGSCRKPHHQQGDALAQLDNVLAQALTEVNDNSADTLLTDTHADIDIRANTTTRLPPPPDCLFLTGDQIYADDVAGPTLHVIQQVIAALGLFSESFLEAAISDASELAEHPDGYYQRENILPDVKQNKELAKSFFQAKRKPIFTSVNAQNHLMSFAENIAMYLLTWSPTLWQLCSLSPPAHLDPAYHQRYADEVPLITNFVATLPKVQRALAHIPTYMIFDDHDVTDDWNLTRGWEADAYNHPLSKRMIGNALLGYFLCQGSGNQPKQLTPLFAAVEKHISDIGIHQHDELLDVIFAWSTWHYSLKTQPPVRVLDTRTQRWRSESNMDKPSGLMDWESLVEFQQSIVDEDDVIVISAAPIYGVKFIEMIQRVFTWLGQALTVDAENWMAHRGTANVMLNIFRHVKTPPRFIILSGDVHYSFVYDVKMRFQRNSPQVLQFTCSGLKNAFPTALISKLDTLNRWFYGSKSPLNVFTKRRHMKISTRQPLGFAPAGLINHNGIGILHIPELPIRSLEDVECSVLTYQGHVILFKPRSKTG